MILFFSWRSQLLWSFWFYPTKQAYNAKIDNQFVLELSLNKNKQYHGILNIYEMPKTIVIDGKKMQNKEDFYQEIEKNSQKIFYLKWDIIWML